MNLWLQHLLVLLIVGACVAAVGYQGVRTLRGRTSKLGSCCAKGCDASSDVAKPQAGERVVFFPSEMLVSSARQREQHESDARSVVS